MKRWMKLVLVIGLSLLLVMLTTVALHGESTPASMPSPETPKNLASLEQSDSAPPGVAAYEGVDWASWRCYFPFANHDPSGWSTELFFQNTDDSYPVDVNIYLYDESGELSATVSSVIVPPAGRGSLVVSDVIPSGFSGAAVVEVVESGFLACSAEVFKDDYSSDLMAYRAPRTDWKFVAPQVRKGSAGWNSRIVIYNASDGTNDVYIDFYDHDGIPTGSVSKTLSASETWVYDAETSGILPSVFDGWASIYSGNEYEIAVVVLNEKSDGGAAAFTPWESPEYKLAAGLENSSSYGPIAVLPWVKRNSTTEINFYNLDSWNASVWENYFAASDGTQDYGNSFFLGAHAKLTRNLDDLPLPTSDWSGAVLASFYEGESQGSGGMTALTDWGTAASGYSSFPGGGVGLSSPSQFFYQFWLPNIYRHPHKSTAFTIWSETWPDNDVSVRFYNEEGFRVFSYTATISPSASIRFDQGDMEFLGPHFDGSVHIVAKGDIAVVVEEKVLGPPPEQDEFEPSDDPDQAHPLTFGSPATLTALISHRYDPDWYTFAITEPSFITVELTNLPHDYNIVLFEDLSLTPTVPITRMACSLIDGAGVNKQGEIESTQWMASPWMASQWMASQWMASQWMASPWMASPWMASPWMASPWMASQWMASSTHSGTQDEIISTIGLHKGDYYVLVYSVDGEYSDSDTYSLTVRVDPLTETIGTCEWDPAPWYTDTNPADVYAGRNPVGTVYTEPLTLILYNKARLDHTYGYTDGDTISDTLKDLADLASVRGLVVPVEDNSTPVYSSDVVSDAYAAWITAPNYCDVTYAISVANAIRDHVISPTLAVSPTISYVVLVGGDDQIPFYRTQDRNNIANEREYGDAMGANTEIQALRAALLQRYLLTDNFYGTLPGEELLCHGPIWLPTLAVGRLVETPDEILGMINGYVASDTLTATTALATGYDFFDDGGEVISDTFGGQGLTTTVLISEMWDADDLATAWLTDTPDLASVNAHFNHWGARPATTTAPNLYVESSEEVSATDNLSGQLSFSIGCHSGLPVPDDDVTDPATSPDWPQVIARKGGYWVANTGYGYGQTESIGGSEMLMWYFAQELGREDKVPAGEALMWAKRRYLGGVSGGGFGDIHRKVMHESTFYGLPMYLVDVPVLTEFPPPISHTKSATRSLGGGLYAVTIAVTPTLDPPHITPDGVFYSIHGETQNRPGRPNQPQASVPLTRGLNWHGAMMVGGEFTDIQPFDPVVVLPVTTARQLAPASEPKFEAPGWFPARPFALNRFGNQLIVVPGQFNNQEGGVERLYSEMEFWVYYSDGSDYTPPEIPKVTTEATDDGWDIDVQVADPSGVQDVVLTYAASPWKTLHLAQGVDFNHWYGHLGDVGNNVLAFVQAVDKAGNVAMVGFFNLTQQAGAMAVGGITAWPSWRATQLDAHLPFLPVVLRDY